MGHNITKRDNIFTVREPGWHGLGVVFDDYPSREEAQKLVHPWEPVDEPIYRRVPTITAHTHTMECTTECDLVDDLGVAYEEVESHVLNVRSDDGYPLGVVSSAFQAVSNTEMWDIAEHLQGEGVDVRYETGGSLKGGAKVWLLLRLEEPIELPGDPHSATIPYYAIQNSHDGSGSFRGQAITTRIVCDNTSLVADLDAQARGTEFVFRHTSNILQRVEEARAALSGWRRSVDQWKAFSLHMMDQAITEEHRDLFLEQFIPMPAADIVSDRVRGNIEKARSEWLGVFNGVTCEAVNQTALGLVHASVEYAEHYRKAKNAESRFKRAYLDRSEITSGAVKLVRELVSA